MTSEQILNHLSKIFSNVFKNDKIEINLLTSSNDIGDWNSISNLFLIDEIEKAFNIKFSLDDIFNFQTVGDICNVIFSKLNKIS